MSRTRKTGRSLRTVRGVFFSALVATGALALASPASAQTCQPAWADGFDLVQSPALIGDPGFNGEIYALSIFDDGMGPSLYAAGHFTVAGFSAAQSIAEWDGSYWCPLGVGISSQAVLALTVFDDGTGSSLYVGGSFVYPGRHIAKWDGSSWSSVGSGVDGGSSPRVSAFTVFDDGTGPSLYAAGKFTSAGSVSVNNIAKWDGTVWSPLGSGMSSKVFALTVFDDGSGPAIYAGGSFATAGGVSASRIAKWDGLTWSPLGSGVNNNSNNASVSALTVFDDGTGQALYAGGSFTTAGGASVNNIAKWDGSTWNSVGNGLNFGITSLLTYDDGTGAALYAGGYFTTADDVSASRIARWDGYSWSSLGAGMNNSVLALAAFDDGAETVLVAGGTFTTAGGEVSGRIGQWNGFAWADTYGGGADNAINKLETVASRNGTRLFATGNFLSLGGMLSRGVGMFDGRQWQSLDGGVSNGGKVNDLVTFNDGSGGGLFACGDFTSLGSVSAKNIARWDGQSWSGLEAGSNTEVKALAVFDDGTGAGLYAGGDFFNTNGQHHHIAHWDGQEWAAAGELGALFGSAVVNDLVVFDEVSGPALYVGGEFTSVTGAFSASGGNTSNPFLARWDGAVWSAVGAGVNSNVTSMSVLDDGTGQALWVRGAFTMAGGQPAEHIARWDGLAWNGLGGGTDIAGIVKDLAVFDDGMGPAVYATGTFTSIGGVAANRIAKWDGASWSALGSGLNDEGKTLAVLNDGNGLALYVGGAFTEAGGVSASHIARWDGANWSVLDLGIDGSSSNTAVNALAVFDGPTGPALYIGGKFDSSGGLPAANFARWDGCATSNPADLNGDGVVNGADLAILLIQWGADGSADFNGDGVVNGADLATLLASWGAV